MSEGFSIEEMQVGQSASMSKTVTEADIILFAGITGDYVISRFYQCYFSNETSWPWVHLFISKYEI